MMPPRAPPATPERTPRERITYETCHHRPDRRRGAGRPRRRRPRRVRRAAAGDVPSDAVATVGDVPVSKADFEQLLDAGPDADEGVGHDRPRGGQRHLRPLRRRRSSTTWCRSRSSRRAPRSSACRSPTRTSTQQVAQLVKAYGGEKKVVALLKEQGMNMELLKRSIRSQTLSQKAVEVVTKDATVSDAEVQAYWDAHKSELLKDKKTNTFAKAKDDHRADAAERQAAAALEHLAGQARQGDRRGVRRRLRPRRANASSSASPAGAAQAADPARADALKGGGRRRSGLRPPPFSYAPGACGRDRTRRPDSVRGRGRPAVAAAGPVRVYGGRVRREAPAPSLLRRSCTGRTSRRSRGTCPARRR